MRSAAASGGKEKPVKARIKKIEASAPKRKAKGSPSGSSKRRCSRSRGWLMPGHRRPRLRDVGCVQCRPVQVVSEPAKGRGHVRGISCPAKWMIVRPRGSYMCGSDWCKYLATEPLHVPGQFGMGATDCSGEQLVGCQPDDGRRARRRGLGRAPRSYRPRCRRRLLPCGCGY